MVEAKHNGDTRAHATAAEHGAGNTEILHHPDSVIAHVLERIRRCNFGRAAIAANVDADDFEPGGKVCGLIHPEIVIERIGMDEDHRWAVAGDLVPDVHSSRAAV